MSRRTILRNILQNMYQYPTIRKPVRLLAQRNFIPKKAFKRFPVDAEIFVEVNGSVSFRYISNIYDKVGRSLYWKGVQGGYEPEVAPVFMKLVQQSKLFLDLGANSGLYTLLACALNEDIEVVAVEPVPRVFDQLQKNVELNNWDARCTLVNRAVSNEAGKATLFIPLTGDGKISEMAYAASLRSDWEKNNDCCEEIEIEMVTVDQLCPPDKIVDLVKMDIEGVEDIVLEGMQSIITRNHPSIIFEARPGSSKERIEDLLIGHGYNLWHLSTSGAHRIKRIEPDKVSHWNFFASTDSAWQQ
jgi:FkbM family methyltransferase